VLLLLLLLSVQADYVTGVEDL